MSEEMHIDIALANMEAGRFSFRTVDAIKTHITKLENELDIARCLHASAVRELKLVEYETWRLERETRSLNAKIHALLRANILTESAHAAAIDFARVTKASLHAFLQYAGAFAKRAATEISDEKLWLDMRARIEGLLQGVVAWARDVQLDPEWKSKLTKQAKEAAAAARQTTAALHAKVVASQPDLEEWRKEQMSALADYCSIYRERASASLQRASAYLSSLRPQV